MEAFGFQMSQMACDLNTNDNSNIRRIIDALNCHWNQDLQQKFNSKVRAVTAKAERYADSCIGCQDHRYDMSEGRVSAYGKRIRADALPFCFT